jgi:hypothetical protein
VIKTNAIAMPPEHGSVVFHDASSTVVAGRQPLVWFQLLFVLYLTKPRIGIHTGSTEEEKRLQSTIEIS